MIRKIVLLLLVFVCVGCTNSAFDSEPESKVESKKSSHEQLKQPNREQPNILLLMAEDMSSRVKAFGDEVAVTPNIDQLASEGVRYTNTFTTAGVCAPSRAALIMGAHQISFGGQHMRTSTRPDGAYKTVPPANMKAFPELLRAAGYYTFNTQKLDYQFSGPMSGSGPFTIWDDDKGDSLWKNKAPDQPFFGYVTFMVTHESGVFPPLGMPAYSERHALMQQWRAKELGVPSVNSPVKAEDVKLEPYYPETQTARQDIARHYNNIAIMDAQVGDVIEKLKQDGLLQNTIVIWTTDHGDGLPRAKRELYDSGLKVPMVIRWPEQYRPINVALNSVDERLLSFVDLAPTILALAGVNAPEYMDGQDFFDETAEEREYIYASRDRIDEIPDRQRAVRDKRFKYIYSYYPEQEGGHHLAFRDNIPMMREMFTLLEARKFNAQQKRWFMPPGEERLFDLYNDPYELNDVSSDAAYTDDLERLRTAFQNWHSDVDDWSDQPESIMVENFRPNGIQQVTVSPVIDLVDGMIVMTCATKGASIGYQINGGEWLLYSSPLTVPLGDNLGDSSESHSIIAKAVRYGWAESAQTELEMNP